MCVFAPELRSHSQKVCTLYKKAMRLIESYYVARYSIRYHQVQLRDRFDKNRNLKDPMAGRHLLYLGQEELFKNWNPLPCAKFPTSLGICAGVANGRVVTPPDWVLDYWHPLERACYPTYFRKREKRKCEFIELWNSGKIV